MTHQRIKNFWINKINDSINAFSLNPAMLEAGTNWAETINGLEEWERIDVFGKNVCRDVYAKAGQPVPEQLLTNAENYGRVLGNAFADLDKQFAELVNVFKTKIGVDPTDDTLATDVAGNNILVNGHTIPKWKYVINKKIPSQKGKLTDIPGSKDLSDLLYENDLYGQITDNTNGLPNVVLRNLKAPHKPNAFGYDWTYKVNNIALQNYKNSATTITNAETHLGLNPGDLATITTNATYKMNGKTLAQLLTPHTCPPCPQTHCPTTHADYNTIKGESTEYQRIHTKLNGKVSDNDLDNLLNQTPNCSHTDYDTIKQALADEKEKLTKKEESWELEKQSAQAEKEKEIINKIITDLGLTTERERERALEAVITEIKAKITPPACDKCSGKDSKISELQEQITNLQAPKTLKDLPISKGVKEEIIKISQELGLTAQSCAKLEKATSYQELSSLQKQAFQERLEKETSDKNSANSLNWALGILTLGSLLVLAWMIMKKNKGILPELDKGEK